MERALGSFVEVEVFIPVDEKERAALLHGRFEGAELYGLEHMAWDATGAQDEALWVAAQVDDRVARRTEDPDGKYMGYRLFKLPRDVVNTLAWRTVDASELVAARQAEDDSIQAARDQARADAVQNGRRLGLIE